MLGLVILHFVDAPTHQLYVVDHITYRPLYAVHRCIHIAVCGVVLHWYSRHRTQTALLFPESANLFGGDIELSVCLLCVAFRLCHQVRAPRLWRAPVTLPVELSIAHLTGSTPSARKRLYWLFSAADGANFMTKLHSCSWVSSSNSFIASRLLDTAIRSLIRLIPGAIQP